MEISQQVIKILDAVCDKFGIAIDWTSNNVIPYIQQLGNKIIIYDICNSIMWLVMLWIMPLIVAIFIKKFLNRKKLEAKEFRNDYYFSDGSLDNEAFYCYLIIGILLVIAIVIGTISLQSIIQDILFPEKTIIEFIKPYIIK